jgi:hypothetical protein
MISLVSNSLVLVGVIILLGSLATVKNIIRRLPLGGSRTSWYAMSALIILFVIGYLGYVVAFWGQHATALDLIVPGIFFFGACFVWLSSILALQTAMDVMRITVLEHESFTDPLTGVYNRRFMEQHLGEEVSKARRYKFDLAVLLLDLDYFKRINDEHGHQAGDQLLAARFGHPVTLWRRGISRHCAQYGPACCNTFSRALTWPSSISSLSTGIQRYPRNEDQGYRQHRRGQF